MTRPSPPALSVVVIVHDMVRAAPRTLLSLSAAYQRHIDRADYDVIVVDNGSEPPFDPGVLERLHGDFRLIRIDDAGPSPAVAANRGLAAARGEVVGVMIDGARLATPGLLHFGRRGALLHDRAVVATPGWYLGADLQGWAIPAGYDEAAEDALLDSIGWPSDGYRLFEVATLDESSGDAWFGPMAESNALFMRRELWDELGGVDEGFASPGGGFVNLDTLRRARALPDMDLVILLGEATMHQVHGGIATNAPLDSYAANQERWTAEYQRIRGHPFEVLRPERSPTYLGTLPPEVLLRLVRTALEPALDPTESPFGPGFDSGLWAIDSAPPPSDPVIAALVSLATDEFRARRYQAVVALCRLIRERAPTEPAVLHMLRLVGRWPAAADASTHLVMAEAHRLLGEHQHAVARYRAALDLQPDLESATRGLEQLSVGGHS